VAAAQNVSKLATVEIRRSNGLKYIFGPCQRKHEEEELLQELKDVKFTTLEGISVKDLPSFVDIFPKCEECMCSLVKSAYSIDESKAQIESEPMKCKILHWIHKYTNKWRTPKIPLDSKINRNTLISPWYVSHPFLFYTFSILFMNITYLNVKV